MKILFPKRMKDLTIIVHNKHIEEVVDSLHESGIVQISTVERDESIIEHVYPGQLPEISRKLTDYEVKMTEVLDTLSRVEEDSKGIMDLIKPELIIKEKIDKRGAKELLKEIDGILEESAEKITGIERRTNEITTEMNELETLEEDVRFIGKIDIDLSDISDTDYTVVKIGKIEEPIPLKRYISELKNAFLHTEPREDGHLFIACAHIREKDELISAIRRGDGKILDLGRSKGTPVKTLSRIELMKKELEDEMEVLKEDLSKAKNVWGKKYNILLEELTILKEKVEVKQSFGGTEHTSVIKAWCSEDDMKDAETLIDKASHGCSVIVGEEPDDPDKVPISLENPSIIRPFELLTNMFAPPRYNEVDPTLILAPAFVIFFGLMLSDSVYGMVITLAALVMVWGPGRADKGTKDFGYILLAAGLSTIIFGIVQGGYMGPESADYLNLPGYLGLSSPAVINTLEGDGPLQLLIISLIIGLAYINIGMVLSLVQHIQRKKYRDIILENVSWWLLQPGGFILVGGEMFGWFDFTTEVVFAAWAMAGIGLILLLIRARGLSFFELTGFIGDFLSFARILALALATAGIALTVNVLTNLVGSGGGDTGYILAIPVLVAGVSLLVVGSIKMQKRFIAPGIFIALAGGLGMINAVYMFYMFALVVLLGGHLVNLVLQALGSFVHALRLQYVEFFGYFYEGGGKEFKPFKPERKYTELISKQEVME